MEINPFASCASHTLRVMRAVECSSTRRALIMLHLQGELASYSCSNSLNKYVCCNRQSYSDLVRKIYSHPTCFKLVWKVLWIILEQMRDKRVVCFLHPNSYETRRFGLLIFPSNLKCPCKQIYCFLICLDFFVAEHII